MSKFANFKVLKASKSANFKVPKVSKSANFEVCQQAHCRCFLAKSKVSIMYARVECYFLYKGGDVLHYDSRKP